MTDTVFVPVPVDAWTQVMAASLTGLISNEGSSPIRIVEAAAAPLSSVKKGHTLNPGANITRTTAVGQEIYAQGISTAGFVAVTSA